MNNIKKILYSILVISFSNIAFIKNFVYADMVIGPSEIIEYSPLYYISIIVVIAIVVGVSIMILRAIYKNNQLEKEEGVKDNDKL